MPQENDASRDATPGRRVLLLGLGNDILADDAVGLRVAAAVRERVDKLKHITVLESGEMGLALLDLVAGFDTLVIVDAVQTGKAPVGFVHELEGDQLQALPAVSPHFLGIGEMLALGAKLELSVPQRVKIFAVEVGDPFTVGGKLSPELEAALPGIVERIVAVARGIAS